MCCHTVGGVDREEKQIMVRKFSYGDVERITALWNRRAVRDGFVGHTPESFSALFLKNGYFSCEHTFILEEPDGLGFVCGCTGDDLPAGHERGYFTCLVLDDAVDTPQNTHLLMSYLEKSFLDAGKRISDILFFNPIHLPWYIPGTDGHQHNNAPGVATDTMLYERLLDCGYLERTRECAMYLNLEGYSTPDWVKEKYNALQKQGYHISVFNPVQCFGLTEMLDELKNPIWKKEIEESVEKGIPFLTADFEGKVVGFAGPVYPEKTGRGYFAGIGVIPSFEGKGLGTQLFYALCSLEKEMGAAYMSLFTGENNPAKKIYAGAGFTPVRSFAIMRKELKGANEDA